MDFNSRKLRSINKIPPLKSKYNDKVFWDDDRSDSWNIELGKYLKEVATRKVKWPMNEISPKENTGLKASNEKLERDVHMFLWSLNCDLNKRYKTIVPDV